MVENNQSSGEISKKLDRIARLLAYLVAAEHDNLEDRAVALSSLGFAPMEIAQVCNTTPNTVRVCLTRVRKRKKGRAKSGRKRPKEK